MSKKANPSDRARNAAHRKRQHHFAADSTFAQVQPTRANLRDEIEQSIGSDRHDGRHLKNENEQRQQEHTAAQSGEADEGAYQKSDQDLECYCRHERRAVALIPKLMVLSPQPSVSIVSIHDGQMEGRRQMSSAISPVHLPR